MMNEEKAKEQMARELARLCESEARYASLSSTMRANENYLRMIIETAPECIKLLARDGTLLRMNRAGLDMSQADSLDQVQGRCIYELIVPAYRREFQTITEEAFEGKPGTLKFEFIGLKGRRLWLETRAVPLRNEKDEITACLGITRDITEKSKMEEELLKMQKLESVGILAGGIAHDFNNILQAIIGSVGLAKMLASPSDKIYGLLTEAENASEQARELSFRLLTFARGGAPLKTTASVAQLLRESVSQALRGSRISCAYVLPDRLNPVEIDSGQMKQVINCLVSNAKEAMPEGGLLRVLAENVTVREQDGLPLKAGSYVRISMKDQGVGIPEENMPRIFDPYFTTKDKGSRRGSGLGLAISYSIVKKHDGIITVESRVGEGSIFHIYLPASIVAAVHEKPVRELSASRGCILFMDDDEKVRDVAAELLKHLGWNAELVESGEEALAAFERARARGAVFDAVILDLTVHKGMGGEQAMKKLLELNPRIKGIVSSGYADAPIMTSYRDHGFIAAIAKPYTIEQLGGLLCEVLGSTDAPSSS